MPLAIKVAGFAAFGVLARAYALGIQRRHPFERPLTHLGSAAFFSAVGYAVYWAEQRQGYLIEKKHREIAEKRETLRAVQTEAIAE